MEQTDHEKLRAVLDGFGVEYEQHTVHNGNLIISLEEGGEKVEGYFGFRTDFEFAPDGRFLEVGAYE